jgi:hypothetical protein
MKAISKVCDEFFLGFYMKEFQGCVILFDFFFFGGLYKEAISM